MASADVRHIEMPLLLERNPTVGRPNIQSVGKPVRIGPDYLLGAFLEIADGRTVLIAGNKMSVTAGDRHQYVSTYLRSQALPEVVEKQNTTFIVAVGFDNEYITVFSSLHSG